MIDTADRLKQRWQIAPGAGQQADLIESARDLDQPVLRNPPVAGLETDDAAVAGGNPRRTEAVAAQGEAAQTGSSCGSKRRAGGR